MGMPMTFKTAMMEHFSMEPVLLMARLGRASVLALSVRASEYRIVPI